MKYTKRLLISMSFFAFLLTVSGCTNEEEIGGGSKEHPAIQTIRATKSDFITTQEVDVPLTRTTIDGESHTKSSTTDKEINLPAGALARGKSYTYTLIISMHDIKLTGEVSAWTDATSSSGSGDLSTEPQPTD